MGVSLPSHTIFPKSQERFILSNLGLFEDLHPFSRAEMYSLEAIRDCCITCVDQVVGTRE